MTEKPFSQACENNKAPILTVLEKAFSKHSKVFEIGSGTGQHAVYLAHHLAHLQWCPSDLHDNLFGIGLWIAEAKLTNLQQPIEFDVLHSSWPRLAFDAIFSANTAHIMPWHSVVAMFEGAGLHLPVGGSLALYGPFKYKGEYTSESNAAFDLLLRERAAHQGIRDFEKMIELAEANDLILEKDHDMPANNRLLLWKKQ